MCIRFVIGSLIAFVAVAPSLGETPLGTAFTYQGQLKQAGAPFDGTADFQFTLWDTAGSGNPPTGGVQVGGAQAINALPVTSGLFTVTLNGANEFGGNAFNGNARWVQIAVRSPAGGGVFTTLAPRQPLTATPSALQTRGIVVDIAGNIGVGTTAPGNKLEVVAAVNGDGIRVTGPSGTSAGLHLYDGAAQRGTLGVAVRSDSFSTDAEVGDIVLRTNTGKLLLQNGTGASAVALSGNNLGIGTTTPGFPLTFPDTLGNKISLFGQSGNHFGLGVQPWLLQIHTSAASEDIAFGYGTSGALAETMRIKGNGNVGIGTTNPDARLRVAGGDVKLDSGTSLTSAGRLYVQSDPADNFLFLNPWGGETHVGGGGGPGNLYVAGRVDVGQGIFFPDSSPPVDWAQGGNVISFGHPGDAEDQLIYKYGAFYFTDSPGGADAELPTVFAKDFFAMSDVRLKKNIEPIQDALAKIMRLQGIRFEFDPAKVDPQAQNVKDNHKKHLGFAAQEVAQVLPEAVHYAEDLDRYSVSYGQLVPVLVEAIKEQQAQIQDLQRRIDELRRR